ncbi:WG repeat-containing protein [bacterium]|nr:WG repeat-containing protein [bacterium]
MDTNKLYVLNFVDEGSPRKGAVNSLGEIVIQPEFESIFGTDTELIPAGILKPEFEDASDLLWGYIDCSGNWKIKAQFDDVRQFTKNWAFAKNKKLWGRIGENGQWIQQPIYKEIGILSEGLVWAQDKSGQYVFLDDDAKVRFTLAGIEQLALAFSEGFLAFKKNKKWGFLKTDGSTALEAKWDFVWGFGNGLAPASEGSSWKYIDQHGNTVIDGSFDEAEQFNGNYAPAKKGKWGIINKKGDWVIKPSSQIMLVPNNNEIITKIKGEWCMMNMKGEITQKTPLSKKIERMLPFDDQGFAIAHIGDYSLLINRNFEIIFDSKKYKKK